MRTLLTKERTMRLLMGFIFYLVYLLKLNVNNVDANKFTENVVQDAEVKLAEMFQRKAIDFKKEFPLSLKEENVVKMTKENLKVKGNITKFFQWRKDIFVAATKSSATLIYLVNFDKNETNLKLLYTYEHSSFMEDVDIFKVTVKKDILWIFQASRGKNVLKVIKINLNRIGSERPFTQLIFSPFLIEDVFPFFNETVKLVLVTKGDLHTGISIYSENGEFLVKKLEYSDKRNLSIKPMFVSSGLYFAFIDKQNTTLMLHEENLSNLKEIQNINKSLVDILIFEDELMMSEFLILVEHFKIEIYLLKNSKLFYWNRIFIDEKIDKSHVFSYEFRNFISLTSKESVSVYVQNSSEDFSLQWKFATCGDVNEIYALNEGEICFIIDCDNITYLKRLVVEDKQELVGEMQNDISEDKSVKKCLNELEKLIKENWFRIPEIKNTLTKKILQQTVANVGNLESSKGTPRSFLQSSRLGALSASVDDLTRKLNEIYNKTKNIEDELQNLLTYKNDQHIHASINVDKMLANYSVIISIDLEKLNGRYLDEYKSNFMTFDTDQFVNTSVYFDKISTDNINTTFFSTNGLTIHTDDLFDVKKPNQIVSGHHSFSSIKVKDSISKGTFKGIAEINGIDVNTFVTKGSNVRFEDKVTFSKILKSEEELLLKYLNGVDYGVWSRSVLKTSRDPKLPFGGSVTVEGNVFVHRNVKASAINGIDFGNLFEKVAKKSNPFNHFKDKVEFRNKLSAENLQVGVVNDAKWDSLLRKRNDRITASFNVDNGHITKDLNTDSINGLDLDKEVLLSGLDQTLQGRIIFFSDVEVRSAAGVTMETGATINAIDPSLHSHLGQPFNQKTFNKKLSLGEFLKVNGSINFSTINGRPLPDFRNGYWSKSKPQQIPHTVTIGKANFRKSFSASTLNGTSVNNFVLTNIPQTITANNFFLSDTLVRGNLYMENDKTIDKVDISFLKESAMNLHERQEIHNLNEFSNGINVKHFATKGNFLKHFNVEDFIGAPFRLSNNVTFRGAVKANSFHTVDLHAEKINGKALNSIIKENIPISEMRGNLYAKKLEVNDLTFTKKLNERNFDTWYKSVVRRTKPIQNFPKSFTILGDVTFNGLVDVDILNSRQLKSFLSKIVEDCEKCEVNGKKVFSKPIEVTGNLDVDFINGVNLNELKERLLSKTKEQTIKGKYKFNSGLKASTVQVKEISGIPLNEVILTNKINVSYPITFETDVKFDQIHSTEGWIDGCQISQVFNPRMTHVEDLVSSNVILGHLDLNGDVKLKGKAFVRLINKDFVSFLKSIVGKTEEQTILGSTLFQSQTSVQALKTDSVNKFSYEEFINKLNQTPTVVKTNCDISLENLYVNKMISEDVSAETVNGLQLKQISGFGVRKDYRGIIKGTKRFLNVIVKGNLKIEKINGKGIDDLVRINGQNENLKLIFTSPLYFKENLNVHGQIAEDDARSLFKHFKNGDTSSLSPFPSHYDMLIVEGDLLVNSINGLNISDILLKSDKFPIITGKKNLIGGIFIEGESKIGTLNGLELNQFKDWSYTFTDIKPERQSFGKYEKNSITQNKVLLSHEAYDVTRINEINLKISKGLFQNLFSITEEDRIQPSGDEIRALRKGYSKTFNVFVQYNPCLRWSLCPCFETYSMKITNNSKLLMDEESIKGINIQIVDEENSKFFNFITQCSTDQASTTVIESHKAKEFSEPIVGTKTKNFGLVLEVLHFHINGKSYLIMMSLKERNVISIKTLNINFITVWEEEFLAKLSKVQVKMIHGNCYLLVVNEEPHNIYHPSFEGTKLYLWNAIKENFILLDTFPLAETGDIVSFGNDSYLVLGFNGKTEKRTCKYSGSDLQIYKSSGKSLYSPFTSLPVSGISSSVFFTVEKDLYLAVASVTENSVSIFRMINQEGFAIQESLYFVSPSEMHYINVHNQHYLMLLEYKTSIVLLKLNFKGASFRW